MKIEAAARLKSEVKALADTPTTRVEHAFVKIIGGHGFKIDGDASGVNISLRTGTALNIKELNLIIKLMKAENFSDMFLATDGHSIKLEFKTSKLDKD